jgi:dTDP-4-amino-4,6-dideoxygalactose transaminase
MRKQIIPFNVPYISGNETHYINQAISNGRLSGNGEFTKKCQSWFENKYGFGKCLLTTSCTDALEMCAILSNIQEGDEVIIPSYTFVSTANAFALRGAKILFADSRHDHPGINEVSIRQLITSRTKAIVVVHYAGVACDMKSIMKIAKEFDLLVIEDAAQAIDSFFIDENNNKIPLGSIGHLAAFSFHETKNINTGEGGMLVINDEKLFERAEIVWEKGTNRSAFFRGDVDKYGWVDIGSSFLPSELISAFLWAQLENIDKVQAKRLELWREYFDQLSIFEGSSKLILPQIPFFASNNAHMFYIIMPDLNSRTDLIQKLRENNIMAVFHYNSLHNSSFYSKHYVGQELINSDRFSNNLLRLPLYYSLSIDDVRFICDKIVSEC